MPYAYRPYPYSPPPGISAPEPRHKVIVIGAGPVGLAMVVELANHGVPSVLLNDNNVVAMGSRAICWSRRSLQIFDKLGIGDKIQQKAVPWRNGSIYRGDTKILETDLCDDIADVICEGQHAHPEFANLQQYYVEEYLMERALSDDLIDVRVRNKVVSFDQTDDSAHVTIETPDGPYGLTADYVIACDGARSSTRSRLDLEFEGIQFEERFIIVDVAATGDMPSERKFWFEPTFHDGHTALLHKQPDGLWRVDLQLAPGAEARAAAKPDALRPRIAGMLGHDDFDIDWVSIHAFQCRRLASLKHGRLIFAGDAAHVVAPFGARGGNGGLQDVNNLGWKLAAVVQGKADPDLLESYDRERGLATDENLHNAAATAKFLSPGDGAQRLFRDAVLILAGKGVPFAGPMVNSGRMAHSPYFPGTGADDSLLPYVTRPGTTLIDAPQGNGWLLEQVPADAVLLAIGCTAPDVDVPVIKVEINREIRALYLGDADQALYLIRPDQGIAARWVSSDADTISASVAALWKGTP